MTIKIREKIGLVKSASCANILKRQHCFYAAFETKLDVETFDLKFSNLGMQRLTGFTINHALKTSRLINRIGSAKPSVSVARKGTVASCAKQK